MAIAEIGGKEFEIPNEWTPEQTQEIIFGQFPHLDPRRGALESGLLQGAKAFTDVAVNLGEIETQLIAGAEPLPPKHETKPVPSTEFSPRLSPSEIGELHGEPIQRDILAEHEKAKATRKSEFRSKVEKLFEPDRQLQRDLEKRIGETIPVLDPEKSFLQQPGRFGQLVTSQAIGLAAEVPIFLLGGFGAVKAVGKLPGITGKFVEALPGVKVWAPGTGRFARSVQASIGSAGAFGGESALRGQSAEEVLKSTVVGAALGPANVIPPKGFKTLAEAAVLIAGESVLHGVDLTIESWANILAILVELKLLHKISGEVIGGGKVLNQAVQIARGKAAVTISEAEAIIKTSKETNVEEKADKIVEESIREETLEQAKEVKTTPEEKTKAEALPVEKGEIDLSSREVGDTVHYTTEKGEVVRAIVTRKKVDRVGAEKEFEIELPDGKRLIARPSAIEPTPDLIRARRERQLELDEQLAIQERIEKSGLGKEREIKAPIDEQAIMQRLDELGQEAVKLGDFASPGKKEHIIEQQKVLIEQLFGKAGEKAVKQVEKRVAERRLEQREVPEDKRKVERRFLEREEDFEIRKLGEKEPKQRGAVGDLETKQKDSTIKKLKEAKKFLDFVAMGAAITQGTRGGELRIPITPVVNILTKLPKGFISKVFPDISVLQVRQQIAPEGKLSVEEFQAFRKEVDVALKKASSLSTVKPLGERTPGQKGSINLDLILPKKLRQGALSVSKDISRTLKLAKELRRARKENRDLGLDAEVVKFNEVYGWGLTILQIADLNKNVTWLSDYVSWTRNWSNDKRSKMHAPDERLKEWNGIGKADAMKLTDALFKERNDGKRMTPEALEKTGMSPEAQILKERISQDFKRFITEVEATFLTDAARKLEGKQLLEAQKAIKEDFSVLKNKPYFPLMRWGRHVVTVRDKEGNVVEFQTRESKTLRDLLWIQLRKRYIAKGFTVARGLLDERLLSLQGMPRRMVDKLTSDLKLSEEQRELLDNLQHKLAPSQSWRKHLLKSKGIKGYSEDAMRAYASYFFHGANHLARLKYGYKMQTAIADGHNHIGKLQKAGLDSHKQSALVSYLEKHHEYIMSPMNELAALRAFGFIWYLGFLPKAAFVNLTQVPLVTYPHLAARFGDKVAFVEIARAYKSMSRGIAGRTKSLTPDEIKAMDRYLDEGHVDQSFAATLGGINEGAILSRLLPQTKGGRTVADMAGKGAYLFSMAEGLNRRVTGLAAYRLARKSGLEHEDAYRIGVEAIDKTQFEYSSWNRPRFMRGKASVIFLFYQFLQNMLYFAARDPGNKRYLAILLATAGAQGLPFMEDFLDVTDRAFGTKNKKYDSRKEMREFFVELGLNPDLIMHGTSRYGLGLPWLARQANIPIPDFDISASISMGRPLRVTEPLLNVTGDFARDFPEAFQNAGGALLSLPMELWKALESDQPWSLKRAENVMPSIGRSVSKSYRFLRDGKETTSSGVRVADFDLNDPEDMTGIGLQATGFIPTEITAKQEELHTMRETVTFYNERRRELLNYSDHAYSTEDQDAIKDTLAAIARYNREVPYKLMSISGTDIVQSRVQRVLRRGKEELGLPGGQFRNVEVMREYNKAFPKRGD